MNLFIYRLLKFVLSPAIFLLLMWRALRGREDKANFAERRGIASVPRPYGTLVWVHGASVGEVVSTLPVLHALRHQKPDLPLLLTTGTITGRRMLNANAKLLKGNGPVIIQYAPLDTMRAVRRFIEHWRPTLSIFTESDFWPELLSAAPNPVLINGRISNRSWPKYQRWSWFFRPLISRFKLILAQSNLDAERLAGLGGGNVHVSGNLKFDADPLPCDPAQLEKFSNALYRRPVLVAGSTHPGEEALMAQLHMALKPSVPELLTIIVPRHPHRGTQVANEVQRYTKAVKRRGLGEMPVLGGARHTDIYIADSLGELGLWYRLATVAVIGGSLVKHGGHNPLESLKLGIPTLAGPYMYNFQDMLPSLIQAGLVTIAADLPTLTRTLQQLFTHPLEIEGMREHIRQKMPGFSGPSKLAATHITNLLISLTAQV